jgi:hypothetical protein
MKFAYLAGRLPGKLLVVAGISAGLLAVSVPASADTFSATFFSVTTSNVTNSDFHTGNVPTGTNSSNYVQNNLSSPINGMPVYNSGHNNLSGTVVAPNDVSGGVIEWWTPGIYGLNTVAVTGNLPLIVSSNPGSPTNMFPPDSQGSTNQAGFEETAILSGDFFLGSGGPVTFSVAADDDAFIFIDGTYLGGLGGIQAIGGLSPFTSASLGAGWHNVEIFYADQDEVAASLAFNDGGTPISATPEPGSLALLGTGVLGLAGTLRRRMMR